MTESKQEVAFRYAVERVNANMKILTKSLLSAQLEKIPPQDSFHASKRGIKLQKMCVERGWVSSHPMAILLHIAITLCIHAQHLAGSNRRCAIAIQPMHAM